MFRDRVVAHWEPDHRRFWYRNDLRGGRKEFILVEAEAGERRPAFDHNQLAASLSAAAGTAYDGEKLPFDQIDFTNGVQTVRFRVADGRTYERQVGYAIIHAGGTQTTDEVTFAEPGDMVLLGARAMEGLNLRVEPRLKRLVDAGPIDAAVA